MNKSRKPSFDILKGLCTLFVVITHFKWTNSQRLMLFFPFWVDMAVPVFMLITGYVYSLSFLRQNIDVFKEAYHPSVLWKRAERIMLPYAVIIVIETAVEAIIGQRISFFWFMTTFITGGVGPGSYYIPVMFQVIFFFPLVYFVVKKWKQFGVVAFLVTNGLFEVIYRTADFPISVYRICVLRYLLFLAFGCCLALKGKSVFGKKVNWIIMSAGIVFIFFVEYLNVDPLIVNYDWKRVSYIAGLYIIPIFETIVLRWQDASCKILEEIGKASYHIFLLQMIYYGFISEIIYSHITCFAGQLGLSIIVCCIFGYVYYLSESLIKKRVIKGH